MIRAIVVDDEPLSRRAMRQLLAAHPDVEIVAECRDAIDARDQVARTSPDLMFLDIRMPGLSGLDFASTRRGERPLIVFVSAYESYALPAYDVDPVDYVTKPVVAERLARTMERVRSRLASRASVTATATGAAPGQHLVARVRDTDLLIPVDDVEFVEADDVYAAVHASGRRYLVRRSLDALAESLDARFLRVHRSYIVRIDRVTAVRQAGGGRRELVLASGAVVPASRRRWEETDAALARRAIVPRKA